MKRFKASILILENIIIITSTSNICDISSHFSNYSFTEKLKLK